MLASGPADAQSAAAQAQFDDGVRLMKQGKLDQACAAFETSNRLEARAGTLLRLGECREKNHQLASAWSAYNDSLTHATDPRKRAFASKRIAVLEPELSQLTVAVPSAARVAGLQVTRDGKRIDPGLWNQAFPIDGGEYVIAATAPGHAGWTATVSVPVAAGRISIAIPALAPTPDEPGREHDRAALAGGDRDAGAVRPATPVPAAHGWVTRRREVALAVLGGAVAATAVGAWLGSSASSARGDAYRLCPDPAIACDRAGQANSLISTAHTRAFEADGAFAVGAVAAAVAGVLWFTGAPAREHVRVEASVGAGRAGLVVTAAF